MLAGRSGGAGARRRSGPGWTTGPGEDPVPNRAEDPPQPASPRRRHASGSRGGGPPPLSKRTAPAPGRGAARPRPPGWPRLVSDSRPDRQRHELRLPYGPAVPACFAERSLRLAATMFRKTGPRNLRRRAHKPPADRRSQPSLQISSFISSLQVHPDF